MSDVTLDIGCDLREVQVVVCPRCGGSGAIQVSTGGKEHFRMERCNVCDGVRVVEKVVSIRYRKVSDYANKSEKE